MLAVLRDKYHPHETLTEKLSAAEDLRAKLINVAAGVRQWSIKAAGDDTLVTLNAAGTAHVHTDPNTGMILISPDGAHFQAAPLEYDPVNHEWVGTDPDTEIVLPPGERRPRKAALVVLAEEIVRVLGEARPDAE